jgi:hypothetical protein
MLNVMPMDGLSNIDFTLEHSLQDLKQIKKTLKYDIFFWYCEKDIPTNDKSDQLCNPLDVIQALVKEQYTVWFSQKPKEEKMDQVTLAIKESKMVILGVSDQFGEDEKCLRVFELVKNIIKKNNLLIEFGPNGSHKWLEISQFASICSDFRIIMQDKKRYSAKLIEACDAIDRQLSENKVDRTLQNKKLDVFISYCWANSHDAIKKGTKPPNSRTLGWLDPRNLLKHFEDNGLSAWLDIREVNNSSSGLFGEIAKGMNEAGVVVACFSDEYSESKNCVLEFRFAHVSLKLPIVKGI